MQSYRVLADAAARPLAGGLAVTSERELHHQVSNNADQAAARAVRKGQR